MFQNSGFCLFGWLLMKQFNKTEKKLYQKITENTKVDDTQIRKKDLNTLRIHI